MAARKQAAKRPAKKAAPRPPKTSGRVTVVMRVSSFEHRVGDVVEVDPATADRLTRAGFARVK